MAASSLLHVFRSVLQSRSNFGVVNQVQNALRISLMPRNYSSQVTGEPETNTVDPAEVDGAEKVNGDAPAENSKKEIRKVVPVETSLRYMESSAYDETYGNAPVWKQYRRNFKGSIAPKKTRKTCIRGGVVSTGNPCPICRDEYLVLDHTNVKLIKQFIDPITGRILAAKKTGVCRVRQVELQVAMMKAMDRGYLTFEVPLRTYKYEEYYPEWKKISE